MRGVDRLGHIGGVQTAGDDARHVGGFDDGPVDGPVMGQAGRSDVSGSRCFSVDEEEVGNRLIVLHILHDLLFSERHSGQHRDGLHDLQFREPALKFRHFGRTDAFDVTRQVQHIGHGFSQVLADFVDVFGDGQAYAHGLWLHAFEDFPGPFAIELTGRPLDFAVGDADMFAAHVDYHASVLDIPYSIDLSNDISHDGSFPEQWR